MEKIDLKNILKEVYGSIVTVNHILRGIRRPSYEKMIELNQKFSIPFEAWADIKSYLQEKRNTEKKEVRDV